MPIVASKSPELLVANVDCGHGMLQVPRYQLPPRGESLQLSAVFEAQRSVALPFLLQGSVVLFSEDDAKLSPQALEAEKSSNSAARRFLEHDCLLSASNRGLRLGHQ